MDDLLDVDDQLTSEQRMVRDSLRGFVADRILLFEGVLTHEDAQEIHALVPGEGPDRPSRLPMTRRYDHGGKYVAEGAVRSIPCI